MAQGGLMIPAPVYVELSAYPGATRECVDDFLPETGIDADFNLSEQVWRLASHADLR
jgi:hypothetical protein